ncbi:uncharacterized protein [Rutidosis leptorrhynchoides]|uniref:uncharacterized protein n=1 Tax=Rutidosis leptorrhynchoides TaxID=125765 RepID=UPI003A98D8D0
MLELENCIIKPPIDFQGFLYLEKLLLRNIEFGANLHGTIINLPQFKMLKLVACTNVDNFKIKSTKLFRLLVLNCPDATLLPLLHTKCLSVVAIVFKNPIQGVERVNLASLLKNMPKWLPHPANSLKFLNLQNFKFGDLFQLQGVLCILRNSPYLERINVTSQVDGLFYSESESGSHECGTVATKRLSQAFFLLPSLQAFHASM